MRTALICTTINTPTVLELYRQHGPDVMFFVAGDRKTPTEAYAFCHRLTGGEVHTIAGEVGYKCESYLWDSIQRRNIALLEAVKWGADIIVSIDDDNIPLTPNYFETFRETMYWPRDNTWRNEMRPWSGLKVSSPTGWFDVGQLLDPIAPHRGFPISVDGNKYEVGHVTNAKVGVAAGMCLGDPDISAVTRIARSPVVHRVSQILESGIVVDPGTKTVFNSQNTAFIRELAPAFFMLPGVGRYDDIYASLIMQRVMRERGLHVHFGKPFVWQQRNQHNLVKDLRGEIDGMEFVADFATCLDAIDLGAIPCREGDPPPTVLDQVTHIWVAIRREKILPPQTVEAALAFLDDMESIL